MELSVHSDIRKYDFETAIEHTGFGKYNISMLAVCCCLVMTMYLEIFGLSVLMPSVACDMSLTTSQQGILSAVPLMGVVLSSYGWGLAADTIGRRKTLLIAMPTGFLLSTVASLAPSYGALIAFKLLSTMFTSAAHAAGFVLMAESMPNKNRCHFMFLMTSASNLVIFLVCVCALPIFQLNIRWPISWLSMVYRPWRLVLHVICLPGAVGVLGLIFLEESPKFLLSYDRNEEALEILQKIFQANTGFKKEAYKVAHVFLDETKVTANTETSFLMRIWNQTAPLFKPPLLKNSLILYYLLLCAFMISSGYTFWLPSMTNAVFTTDASSDRTFCEIASQSTNFYHSNPEDCEKVIQPFTLYAVMCFSAIPTCITILLSFVVSCMGKKKTTLMVFSISMTCGIILIFVKIPLFSIAMFYMFLYVGQILGIINVYLIDLNPTHLRGMASCLSVVVTRGFAFISVQVIGSLLLDYCTSMLVGYIILGLCEEELHLNIILVASKAFPAARSLLPSNVCTDLKEIYYLLHISAGLIVALFLPPDSRTTQGVVSDDHKPNMEIVAITNVAKF